MGVSMEQINLSDYAQYFTEYTELRIQENRENLIVMVNGDLMRNEKVSKSGVSARAHKNGVWGFASDPEINGNTLQEVVESATKNAQFLHQKIKNDPFQLASRKANETHDFGSKKTKWSQKEMIEFLQTMDRYIIENCKNLISRTVVIQTLDMEKSLITSDQSNSFSFIPRSFIIVELSMADKDTQPIKLHDIFDGFGQFEDVFTTPDALFAKMDKIYERLLKKVDGIYPDSGIHDCILDADLAGILAHEAIGHTTEADLVLAGSVAANMMDQEVASPLVTLVDFAHTAYEKTCPVPVYVDDEGVKAEDAMIIEKGILKSYMHNKDSAQKFQMPLTGNARAMQFYDEPLIRMRNTAILPGKSQLKEMIASIDDGYYLMKSSNGQADSTSEFMFGVVQGYEVKNGKLGRALKDITISGIAFDVLKSVSMISDDLVWGNAGMCGKKQWIPVGMGGPAIKCKVNIGGK
jgi:TldD protein